MSDLTDTWRGRITDIGCMDNETYFLGIARFEDGMFWDDGAWVEAPVVKALIRCIGSSDPLALCRQWVEVSNEPMEGALPFHPDGFFIRLVCASWR